MNLKNFVCTAAIVMASAVTTTASLSPARLSEINQQVSAAKTPEAPALVAKLVAGAAKEDKNATAVAAFIATFRKSPGTLTTALTAAIHAAPSATEKLVAAAIALAPESALTVVRTAVDAAPEQTSTIRAIAAKADPSKVTLFDREIASASATRRAVGGSSAVGAAFGGGTVDVTPLPEGPAPVQVYAQPGSDPRRSP